MAHAGSQQYRKPPITEGVVAIHFAEPLDPRGLRKFIDLQKRDFPKIDQMQNVQVDLSTKEVKEEEAGWKLTSYDGLRIIHVLPTQFAVSRMAPYLGWNTLISEFQQQLGQFREFIGRPAVNTISTRFINRIDVPTPDSSSSINVGDYLLIGVALPPDLANRSLASLAVQTSFADDDGRVRYVINMGVTPPALIDHMSIVLDIDVAITKDVPLHDDGTFAVLDEIHSLKNICFESCITDRARELFA